MPGKKVKLGDGPNMVSESMSSSTELSKLFGSHRAPGRELSEFLSAPDVCQSVFLCRAQSQNYCTHFLLRLVLQQKRVMLHKQYSCITHKNVIILSARNCAG